MDNMNENIDMGLEQTTYSVYARVDDKNRVTKIFSDCFEQPEMNDVWIKSGFGDEYVHTGYYQIYNDDGTYRYKIRNGRLSERAEYEREEELYASDISTEISALKDKLDKTDYQTIKRIEKIILEQFYSSLDEESISSLNERQSYRDEINRLQAEQASLEV